VGKVQYRRKTESQNGVPSLHYKPLIFRLPQRISHLMMHIMLFGNFLYFFLVFPFFSIFINDQHKGYLFDYTCHTNVLVITVLTPFNIVLLVYLCCILSPRMSTSGREQQRGLSRDLIYVMKAGRTEQKKVYYGR